MAPNEPFRHRSEADRQALGVGRPQMDEEWRIFSHAQLHELANDVRIDPNHASYDDIRVSWLEYAERENKRLRQMSEIVWDFTDFFDTESSLTPGSVYSVRFRAFQASVNFAAKRPAAEAAPRKQLDMEAKSMLSARLWMKSPAYFLPREHIAESADSDSPLTSYVLPNSKCLVFHDCPLPIDLPIDGSRWSIFAWIFISNGERTMEGAQILAAEDNGTDFLVTNGWIESPALRDWASRILPTLCAADWTTAPRLKLPGKPMERPWRRELQRRWKSEIATGSLDGVRLLGPAAG